MDADLFDRLMEEKPHLLIGERALVSAKQKIGRLIITKQGFAHGEIVVDLCDDFFWERDKSVLAKFGFLDIDGALIRVIILAQHSDRL